MNTFKLTLILILSLVCVTHLSAQKVEKKGVLKMTYVDKMSSFPGETMVPSLEDDAGVIAFQISDEARKYIKEEDVLDWIRSKELKIDEVFFNESQARIAKGTVRLRFNYQFIGRETYTSKRMRIDAPAFEFNGILNYYKQEVVFYKIDVATPPKYDRDIFGSLQLSVLDGDGADVLVKAPNGKELKGTVVSGFSSFSDLTEGNYTVTVSKSGYETETKQIRVIPGPTPISARIDLKRRKLTLNISANISGYNVLIVNSKNTPINLLNQSSSFSIDLEPDTYTIQFTKQDYTAQTRDVTLTRNGQSIRVSLSGSRPKIEASSGSSSNTIWYVLLAAAAGGAAYYFTSGSGSGSSGGGGYGAPPALPVPFSR